MYRQYLLPAVCLKLEGKVIVVYLRFIVAYDRYTFIVYFSN